MNEGKYSSIFIISENDDEFEEQILSLIDKKNAPIYVMELSSGIFTNSNILELEVLIPEKVIANRVNFIRIFRECYSINISAHLEYRQRS